MDPRGQNNEAKQQDDPNAPLLDRLHRKRSVFSPGHRIRMNIVPMFLNIFLPWGAFIGVLSIMSFSMMYKKAGLAYFLIGLLTLYWLLTVATARSRRRADAEPTWFTFHSFMVGLALLFGIALGHNTYKNNSLPYFMIKDLKTIGHLDVSKEHGQAVLDAGIIYFAEGTKIDAQRSWHFKQGSVYCVAPIIKGDYPAVPETQTFDFWAVGKDCCSVSASDFRCGSFNNPLARSAIRVLSAEDAPYYRLAVTQAETLYGVMATHPVFFEWAQDPLETVNRLHDRAFMDFLMYCVFGFVVALAGVSCASCKFAWLGRSHDVYDQDIVGDADYSRGGAATGRDFRP